MAKKLSEQPTVNGGVVLDGTEVVFFNKNGVTYRATLAELLTWKMGYAGGAMTGPLVFAAGTATVAPVNFQTGALLTTPVANAMEYNGTNIFMTTSAGLRKQVRYLDDPVALLTANTFTGDQTYNGKKLIYPVIQKKAEVRGIGTITAGALPIDLNSAAVSVTLNANVTALTFTNSVASATVMQSVQLEFTGDGTQRTVAWPAGNGTSTLLFKWPGGVGPTLTPTAGKRDVLLLKSVSAFLWECSVVGQNY